MNEIDLYPPSPVKTYGYLEASGQHLIYWAQYGRKSGIPVFFIHGGPGAKPDHDVVRLFCPRRYRIIIFHQRGCGKSQPLGMIENNTTQDLVSDIEALRSLLGIERMYLCAPSWGGVVAFSYLAKYQKYCLGVVLSGVFLARTKEVNWLKRLAPRIRAAIITASPQTAKDARINPLMALYRLLLSDNPETRAKAVDFWFRHELSFETDVSADTKLMPKLSHSRDAQAAARIGCHYLINNYFVDPKRLVASLKALTTIFVIVVQGKNDAIGLANCRFIAENLSSAKTVEVRDAGHSILEKAIRSRVVAVFDWLTSMT